MFDETVILARAAFYGTHIVMEVLEIQLESKVLNRGSWIQLSKNWRPVIHLLAPAVQQHAIERHMVGGRCGVDDNYLPQPWQGEIDNCSMQ